MLYLKWFSQQLKSRGRQTLDYRWNISIVGGIDRIPGVISLFRANRLQVAAVVDVQQGHKQKLENAKKSLANGHLLSADTYSGQKEADFEDIMGREFYMALVNKAYELQYSHALDPATKASTERVAKEVETAFAVMPAWVREFDHFTPAEYLFQKGDEGAKLPGFDDALNRVEKVISDLNVLLE